MIDRSRARSQRFARRVPLQLLLAAGAAASLALLAGPGGAAAAPKVGGAKPQPPGKYQEPYQKPSAKFAWLNPDREAVPRTQQWDEAERGAGGADPGRLVDAQTSAEYDLRDLYKISDEHRQFFNLINVKGGPHDEPNKLYDYLIGHVGFDRGALPRECQEKYGLKHKRGAAYQISHPRHDHEGAGRADEDYSYDYEDVKEARVCTMLGKAEGWKWRMVNQLDPEAGVQIHYTGGEECMKRVQRSELNSRGKKRTRTSWEPATRNTTITFKCNPNSHFLESLRGKPFSSRQAKNFLKRDVPKSRAIQVNEPDMCHYELTWETPYGCPTTVDKRRWANYQRVHKKQKKEALKKASASSWFGSGKGRDAPAPDVEAPRRTVLGMLFKLVFYAVAFLAVGVAVQVFRKKQRMRIIIPQLFDATNKRSRQIALKRFVQVVLEQDKFSRKTFPASSREPRRDINL